MKQSKLAHLRTALGRFGQVVLGLVFLVVVVGLLLWLAGFFHAKIPMGEVSGARAQLPAGARIEPARRITVPDYEMAIGAIRPVRQTDVASRILSRILAAPIQAGQQVTAGELLVELDDTDLRQRLQQAAARVDAEQSAVDQAAEELRRLEQSYAQSAASEFEVIRARNAVRAAEASLQGAIRAREEGETVLGYARITAPFDGVIIDKRIQVGDTVIPGQTLLTMYDPSHMQLIAEVRETLAGRLRIGDSVTARIDALDMTCPAEVTEIVPQASAASRSFQVKVSGECPEGVLPGMFGRLQIPLDDREILVIPAAAVRQVGQLTLVTVLTGDGAPRARAVQLGRTVGDDVEVLAGLRAGEQVVIESEPDR
ncbi:MAG: efflux RND transporter periplasmic adaptor subunit [Phycisphaerales bacterium JB039]